MLIEIEKLTKEPQRFQARFSPAEINLDDEFLSLKSDVEISVQAQRRGGGGGNQIELAGTVKAEVEAACDRCADAINTNVAREFEAAYLAADEFATQETKDLASDELNADVYHSEVLNLADVAREQLLLAFDTQILCRENCLGLCARCGANLNYGNCGCEQKEIDPRWAGLANLKVK